MILDAHSFGGLEISPYMDFIESQLIWFDEFYQQQQQARDVRLLPAALDVQLTIAGLPLNWHSG